LKLEIVEEEGIWDWVGRRWGAYGLRRGVAGKGRRLIFGLVDDSWCGLKLEPIPSFSC
jgi:hypothetical protein